MAFAFKQDFNNGVNLDLDETRIPPDMVQFLKNMTASVTANPDTDVLAGSNQYSNHPLEGNTVLTIAGGILPTGDNRCIGFYSSEQTNEGYFFIYNSLSNHTIWVIGGDTGTTRKVAEYSDLPFTANPSEFLSEGRVTLELRSYINKETGLEDNFKFLIFTNGLTGQFFISVEDSANTAAYTIPSGYFGGAGTLYDRATLFTLTPPTPNMAIDIAPVPFTTPDEELLNNLIRNAYQFRVKFIDVFGRESEHGIISDQYISIVSGGCLSGSDLPRCLDLIFDAGNPLVDKIQIEYRKWSGDVRGVSLNSGWFLYDVIDRWDNSASVSWYDRSVNPDIDYNGTNNTITYRFCADKNCQPISDIETSRTEPDTPRFSNGVFSINKRIGLANNVRGFEPINPAEIAKVAFSNVVPETDPCPAPPMRKIVMYANIYKPVDDASARIRKSHDKYVFGDEDGDCTGATLNSFRADQVFGDQDNPGFIFYLAGTNYATVAQWGAVDLSGPIAVFTPLPSFPDTTTFGEFMMRIEFNVPAGRYVIRGASHKARLSDADYQKTSTYIAGYGTLNSAFSSTPFVRRNAYVLNPIKEWEVDVSTTDYFADQPLSPMFIVMDLSGSSARSAVAGYLVEDTISNVPVEMAPVIFGAASGSSELYGSVFTDHNGFYFATTATHTLLAFCYDFCDGAGLVMATKTIQNLSSKIKIGDGTGTGSECSGCGNWRNRVSILTNTSYTTFPAAARRTIKQRVLLCGTTSGVGALPVIMTKGAVTITGPSGRATLIAHNRSNYLAAAAVVGQTLATYSSLIPNYSIFPNNQDNLVFSQRGLCPWSECGKCDYSIPDVLVEYIDCCPKPPLDCTRVTNLVDASVSLSVADIKGIQSGGRYPVGFILYDNIGRHTFVQRQGGDAGFVSAPNLNDATFRKFELTSIGFTIDPTTVFPSYFKYMTFCVAENTLFTDYFSWDADYVQFVDNTGATNTVNPTQIRIYYGSLNEYNKQFNFATNTGWTFQTTDGASKVGDSVEFIMNGNAAWFDTVISCPVLYDSAGLFFTIDYDDRLKNLTNGALYRVTRPKTCQTNYIFYEQCLTIKLVDGVPQTLTGTIPYFDSYMLSRALPVPILKGQPGPLPPGGTPPNPIQYTSTNLSPDIGYASTNPNSNNVLVMSTQDALTTFPFYFESPSPSDFWGSHLANRGRINVENRYERQQRISTEIALSAALSDRGLFNGLSFFESKNAEAFDRNTWGGITAVLVEVGKLLVICDSDHFHVEYNNTQLRVDDEGNVLSQNTYGIFTSPHRPSGTPFGCIPDNINTIRKYEGIVMWLDAKGRLVRNDFSSSVDVSMEDKEKGIIGGYGGYLRNKISTVNKMNLSPMLFGVHYFIGGIDPVTKEYHLTTFGTALLTFINTQVAPSLQDNETIRIAMSSGILRGFSSYTPEMYGYMTGFYSGKNMFSFKEGFPWKHHRGVDGTPPLFANFYGTQCECIVTPVANGAPHSDVEKRFLYIEVFTRQNISNQPTALPSALFYSDSIKTEKGQLSRLAVQRFDLRDGYQCAAFLCDLNTPTDSNLIPQTTTHKILDGNPLIGRWLAARLRTNSSWTGTYFEISSSIIYMDGIEPTDKQ